MIFSIFPLMVIVVWELAGSGGARSCCCSTTVTWGRVASDKAGCSGVRLIFNQRKELPISDRFSED